jgi:hypothetical protein
MKNKPPIRSRWREFRFAHNQTIQAIIPRVSLATVLENWHQISRELSEPSRARQLQLSTEVGK